MKYLPVADIARQLSCSQETVRRLVRDGRLPALRVGSAIRLDPEAVKLALSRSKGGKAG